MLGSIGFHLGASGGWRSAFQNVALRGQAHNATAARQGSKTRMKGIGRFVIGAGGARVLQPVFSNIWFNGSQPRERGGAAYTIRKAAMNYGGRTVPLLFDGARSVRLSAGAVDLRADPVMPAQFGVLRFAAGDPVFIRMSLDLPETPIAAQAGALGLTGESQLLYNPANEVDDIDATSWSVPADADRGINFPHAILLAGEPDQPVTSLVALGDDLLDGLADVTGDGTDGGGWLRRAAALAGLPVFLVTCAGDRAQFAAAANLRTRQLLRMAGAQAALLSIGQADLREGRSASQLLADLRNLWSALRGEGIQRLVQAQLLAETSASDQNSSTAGQTTRPAFLPGSARDDVNASIASLASGALDDQVDLASAVQSLGKWDIPAFETTLASAASAGSTTISLNKAPERGDFLAFEPGTPANQDATTVHVVSVSGSSSPFSVALSTPLSKAHAAGVTVTSSLSADGVHPQQQAHKRMATKAAPAMRRLRGVATPWIDPSRSFEIDFVNRRAQRGGSLVPVEALVSCVRASGGKAFDGLSWFDFSTDSLRYADGGGLFIEPAATNLIPNNSMAGGVAPSTKPTGWVLNLPSGLSATYAYGVQSGIAFSDIRLAGTTPSGTGAGNAPIDFALSLPVSTGDSITHSAFLALPGPVKGLSGLNLGGRVGNSAGTGVDFPASPDLRSNLTARMQRFSHSFVLSNAATASLHARLNVSFPGSTAVDTTIRIGLPQLEKAGQTSSPIATTGTAATRAADIVTLTLPAGRHDVTLLFDDGSVQTLPGLSGSRVLPALNRRVIQSISGAAS
ncbi:hypothetical protein BJF93_03580 [Xaviernesmea oryzae]|uniref:Uncharacterized protein n=1 Tax=Xaviernesmea oryzae TaxID=464029 RepID=A0A1Q9AUB8_9HYPH|nr:hypothetical protein [Xaviernesmea oryzae]OLP59022.1 hypothetical protein BJF93_03580 [Xaviernesmea oryzae]SEK90275.1 hypothetical protein SAMN04487976_104329 [Xaviernesmea oryzae]